MNSSEEEELALHTFVLIDDEHRVERKKKRKHRFWIREIYKQRDQQGVFSNLLREPFPKEVHFLECSMLVFLFFQPFIFYNNYINTVLLCSTLQLL